MKELSNCCKAPISHVDYNIVRCQNCNNITSISHAKAQRLRIDKLDVIEKLIEYVGARNVKHTNLTLLGQKMIEDKINELIEEVIRLRQEVNRLRKG